MSKAMASRRGLDHIEDGFLDAAGDMVMASPNGRARVAYGSNCILEVEPGMVVTVPPDDSCTRSGSGLQRDHYIIGGLVIAGGAVAAIVLSQDKDKSASP